MNLEIDRSRVGLKVSKFLSPTDYRSLPVCINGQNIEKVNQFVYLGSVVCADCNNKLNVARCINNTKSTVVTSSESENAVLPITDVILTIFIMFSQGIFIAYSSSSLRSVEGGTYHLLHKKATLH